MLAALAEQISDVMDQPLWQRLRDDSVADAAHMRIHVAEHRMIYEAIASGDAAAAEFYAAQHIDRVRTTCRSTKENLMRFPGVIPALTTPFAADGAVDHAALARSVERMLGAGMAGFVGTGTMGEAQSLTRDERRAVIATIVETVDGRVPVTAGISSETPALSSAYAADAAAAGASAVMLLPSLGYEGDAREIVAFYRAVADTTELPMMAYNNPKASGTDMPVALILAIAEAVEQVVAVKECSGDARRIAAARRRGRRPPRGARRRRRLGAGGLRRRARRAGSAASRSRRPRPATSSTSAARPATSRARAPSTRPCCRSRAWT